MGVHALDPAGEAADRRAHVPPDAGWPRPGDEGAEPLKRNLALISLLLLLLAAPLASAEEAAHPAIESAAPSVSVQSDGFLWHSPSGLRLPREIAGPARTHIATLTAITPDKVELVYGPITVTIGAPAAAADPAFVPPGWKADADAPSLPGLLFWGEGARPMTVSFLHAEGSPPQDWLSFSVVSQGWQIEFASLYPPESREVVIRTAEAVWAILASANAEPPKPPPAP